MKFLLAHFIVVPLIIFIVSLSKGTKALPAQKSCEEVYNVLQFPEVLPNGHYNLTDGYYNITTDAGIINVHCNVTNTTCTGSEKGWMRVGYVDAKKEAYTCNKSNLSYTEVTHRKCDPLYGNCSLVYTPMCIRSRPEINGCFSFNFSTFGIPYTKVCGRARGYQLGFTRAFHSYAYANQSLNGSYVSGLSVTRGDERKHIWTFAAGYSQAYGYATVNCPCAYYPGPKAPPFVGKKYFCESGNPDNVRRQRYMSDPLWDSKGCATGSKCCDRDGPWFTTELRTDKEESDYIEVRMCRYPRLNPMVEDIGLDELEIYVH